MLLGRHMYENSNMDGTFDATATANNHLLLNLAFENLSSSTFSLDPPTGLAEWRWVR